MFLEAPAGSGRRGSLRASRAPRGARRTVQCLLRRGTAEPAAPSIPARWFVAARCGPALPRVPAVVRKTRRVFRHHETASPSRTTTPRGTGDGVPRHARASHALGHALPAGGRLIGRPVPGPGSARAPSPWRPRGACRRACRNTRRPRGEVWGHCGPMEPPRPNARWNRHPGGTERGRPLDPVRRRKHRSRAKLSRHPENLRFSETASRNRSSGRGLSRRLTCRCRRKRWRGLSTGHRRSCGDCGSQPLLRGMILHYPGTQTAL
jgi:hypothetical protein